jgi:aminoacylase
LKINRLIKPTNKPTSSLTFLQNKAPPAQLLKQQNMLTSEEKEDSVQLFRKLVQFPTISNVGTEGSYDQCANHLLKELVSIGLDAMILPESKPKKPITWKGSRSDLPGILLNSHYDVVPIIPHLWTVPAFEAVSKDGKIYGRGTQDMKCVCAQYLTALRKLKKLNYHPVRNIYITFVPDEEVGGVDGMNILTISSWFKAISIDLALDEGLANPGNEFTVFYGERMPWWIKVKAVGNTGHGSRFIDGTAVEQIVGVVNKALDYRQTQKDRLHGMGNHAGCSHAIAGKKKLTLGDVTSINVTMLRAMVESGGKDVVNVIPPCAEASFDIRIAPDLPPQTIEDTFNNWCHEIQSKTNGLNAEQQQGLSWEFIFDPLKEHHVTSLEEKENPWWNIFASTMKQSFDVEVVPEIFPAATDSRFLRTLGLKVFGFSPIRNSPILLHEHDEYLEEKVFLEGCEIYVKLIESLSSQGQFQGK